MAGLELRGDVVVDTRTGEVIADRRYPGQRRGGVLGAGGLRAAAAEAGKLVDGGAILAAAEADLAAGTGAGATVPMFAAPAGGRPVHADGSATCGAVGPSHAWTDPKGPEAARGAHPVCNLVTGHSGCHEQVSRRRWAVVASW